MNDAVPSPEAVADLEAQLLVLLNGNPAGLSEHELLKCLRKTHPSFANFDARQPLSLFRGHFLLFHALYRLRDRLSRERSGRLVIGPLRIALERAAPADAAQADILSLAPSASGDVAGWYADLRRWQATTAAEVVELLRQFHAARRANGRRQAALAELGLQDPVDDAAIKRRYRRLAMCHHPDRGGDGQRLREINAALAVLRKGWRRTAGTEV
ncbi:MAG TPA: DNA-J related domain-containing protein [Candidatus Competibacter sp.]|nr:DNA-J related domain-containing protein [Candidatus Competibacter sp.]